MDQPSKNGSKKSDDEPEAIDPAHLPRGFRRIGAGRAQAVPDALAAAGLS
jgi:hypothetical protein